MEFDGWVRSETGDVRWENQDSYLSDPQRGLFLVADGMGGRADGGKASQMVIEEVGRIAEELVERVERANPIVDHHHRRDILQFLGEEIERINAEIFEAADGQMGTTCDLLHLAGEAGFIAHVGDSRIYMIRQGRVVQLTDDHTHAARLEREARRRKTEVSDLRLERYAHVLTRAIGTDPRVDIDTLFIDVRPGDLFVICSDGVSDVIDDNDLLEASRTEEPERLADRLVEEAYRGGSTDNATAVTVSVDGPEPSSFGEGAPVDTIRKVTFLEQVPLFAELNSGELLKLLRIVYRHSVAPGEIIIRRGESADRMFMVLEGEVSLQVDDREIVRLGPGEHFGEMGLFGTDIRTADAVPVEETVLLVVPSEEFRRLVESEDPVMGNKLLSRLLEHAADRLQATTEELLEARK